MQDLFAISAPRAFIGGMMRASIFLFLILLTRLSPAADVSAARAELEKSANAFIESLDEDARNDALLPFDDDERENWHYTPGDRRGIMLKSMSPAQKKSAMALVETVLSEKGMLKASQILVLEGVLAELENNPTYRDPGKYTLTFFGKPSPEENWGFRFEGHHLSLNITLVDEGFSVTPSFLGANPAEVRKGEHQGLRPLAAEEDLARALVLTLGDDAVFDARPPQEILTGEKREASKLEAVGVKAADMTEGQRAALLELISEYIGRYRVEFAESDMERIKEAGVEKIHFGWAGSLKPGEAYYYRIQGPTFLMEAANTQNNANHIHAVWRDFERDFGRDLLREHYHDHE